MDRTKLHADLLAALSLEGCAVCRVALRTVEGYLTSLAAEGGMTDPALRARIRDSHGFCAEHAHWWLEGQHVLSTALIYQDVLTHVAEELRSLRFERRGLLSGLGSLGGAGSGGRDLRTLDPHAECLGCRTRADAERVAVEVVLAGLREARFGDAYAASDGLCLPHLKAALAEACDEETFRALIGVALGRHEALVDELREIVRKHDYRYTREPVGPERDAEARAVRHAVGARGIGDAGRR